MAMVLDASVVAASLLPDDRSDRGDCVRASGRRSWIVPAHWWFEIRNILIVAEHRSRLTLTETERLLQLLGRLPITIRTDTDEAVVLQLARRHRLTVYDAAYLELAQRLSVPLATLDRAIIAAAKNEGVTLVGIDV